MGHYHFSSHPPRTAFSLKELLVVITVIGVVLALALPAVQKQREDHRKVMCQHNLKQIALALQNYEDKRKCLPPISTNTDQVPDIPGDPSDTTDADNPKPGSAPSTGAGYSWHVLLLPEAQSSPLYESIVAASQDFTRSAFSKDLVIGTVHPATIALEYLRCPSFSGGSTLDTSPRTAGKSTGTIETGSVPPNYVGGFATAGGAKGIALTNYNAILGTHIDTTADKNYPARSASLENSNNGLLSFRGTAFDEGRNIAKCYDGLTYTIIVAETRERRFSSWYDGTMNWVVRARHSNPSAGTTAIVAANNTTTNPSSLTKRWSVVTDGTDGTSTTGGTALNYGPTKANPTAVYLPTAALADPDISGIPPGCLWGPSSEHSGRIVNHGFADGHVSAIRDDIDPNIYLWATTRDGTSTAKEPVVVAE